VLPVLFLTLVFGAITVCPSIIFSYWYPELMMKYDLYVPSISLSTHIRIFIKAAIVSASWMLAYSSLKHLPISIASPIKALGPVFTIMGGLLYFRETPNLFQWSGLLIIIGSVFWLSRIGKKEKIVFRNNKWIYFAFTAVVISAISGLYDKELISKLNIHPQVVQSWFAVYLVLIQGIVILTLWLPFRNRSVTFKWRWSIPLVGVLLIIADFIYFRALTFPMVSIILLSAVKRTRVLVASSIGGIIFKEKNKRKKILALIGILAGVVLIMFGTK